MTDRLTVEELDELESLIAAALNALPRLIAAAREEERLWEVLRLALEAMSEMDFALDTCGAHQRTRGRGAAARLCARAALAGKDGE